MHGTSYSWIAPTVWPKQLRWVQAKLGIRSGSPRFIVVSGDTILIHRFGRGSWNTNVLPLIERTLAQRTASP